MNKQKVKELREKIRAHLNELDLGVNIELGNASFDETSCRIRLEISEIRGDGMTMDGDAQAYLSLAHYYDMNPEWLGKTFNTPWADGEYTLLGMRTRNRKYPIIATRNGKRYKLPTESVKLAFNKKD